MEYVCNFNFKASTVRRKSKEKQHTSPRVILSFFPYCSHHSDELGSGYVRKVICYSLDPIRKKFLPFGGWTRVWRLRWITVLGKYADGCRLLPHIIRFAFSLYQSLYLSDYRMLQCEAI